jgi:CRISPR/Cas system-associated endonuclease Cas1
MRLALMADDRDLIIGEIRGSLAAVKDHLDRQDRQRDTDKAEAIQAREEKHAENLARFSRIEAKATETYGAAMAAFRWVEDKGEPLIRRVDGIHDRLSSLEDTRRLRAAEARGEKRTWNWIWGTVVAVGGAIGTTVSALLGLSPETIDSIKRFFHAG